MQKVDLDGNKYVFVDDCMIEGAKDLVDFREQMGWTQEEAALQLGVPVATLRNWEQGKTKVPPYFCKYVDMIEIQESREKQRDLYDTVWRNKREQSKVKDQVYTLNELADRRRKSEDIINRSLKNTGCLGVLFDRYKNCNTIKGYETEPFNDILQLIYGYSSYEGDGGFNHRNLMDALHLQSSIFEDVNSSEALLILIATMISSLLAPQLDNIATTLKAINENSEVLSSQLNDAINGLGNIDRTLSYMEN